MLLNSLQDRVQIQVKTTTQTALGQSEVWKPYKTRYASIIPLDAKTIATYQQMKSEVTHKILFRDSVDLSVGSNRILHGDKTYQPVLPTQTIDNATAVVVKEI